MTIQSGSNMYLFPEKSIRSGVSRALVIAGVRRKIKRKHRTKEIVPLISNTLEQNYSIRRMSQNKIPKQIYLQKIIKRKSKGMGTTRQWSGAYEAKRNKLN
jgi:hypothetical protein